ncbi:hypothetical protein [Paraburkholderia caledonica]|uniref:hypothetical protein n=1 Tax=Paraburkholderia caledonica TaxID=134536 RepID=UPI0015C6473D|nr:hypothetical protein [Paraburkholderia caledonica]
MKTRLRIDRCGVDRGALIADENDPLLTVGSTSLHGRLRSTTAVRAVVSASCCPVERHFEFISRRQMQWNSGSIDSRDEYGLQPGGGRLVTDQLAAIGISGNLVLQQLQIGRVATDGSRAYALIRGFGPLP